MKPGFKTSEFWISTIVALIGVLAAAGFITPDQESAASTGIAQIGGAFVTVAAAFGYNLSRGKAKAADATVQVAKLHVGAIK